MTRVDQFESVFKSAAKEVFRYQPVHFAAVLVVTDLDPDGAHAYGKQIREFLRVLGQRDAVDWRCVSGAEFRTVDELMALVANSPCDLICTYRNLHSEAAQRMHSLGSHLDVLTQATRLPVVVLPHPAEASSSRQRARTKTVMAMTDHLAGEARLVNFAARFTEPRGTIFLTHIEDEAVFERYIDAISKIPGIDTEVAREEILQRLLKEPRDYIRSCRESLEKGELAVEVKEVVQMGHHLSDYGRLIDEHDVDLLVMNTKDEDQLAMHGLAYPLAVELRHVPLLLV